MFGSLGFSEILVITVIALIVFGPKRLPEIARTIAKSLNQFRRTAADLKSTVEREVDVREFRDAVEGVRAAARLPHELLASTLADPRPPAEPSPPTTPADRTPAIVDSGDDESSSDGTAVPETPPDPAPGA